MPHFMPPLFFFILLLTSLAILPFTSILPLFTHRALGETKNLRGTSKPVSSKTQGNPATFQGSRPPPPPAPRPATGATRPAAVTPSATSPNSNPETGETQVYVVDLSHGQDIVVTVENNVDPWEDAPEMIGNEQPLITNGEDVFISSWWTVDEGAAFENWEQLEAFLGSQFGREPQTGINPNAEDLAVEIEVGIPANLASEAEAATAGTPGTENINLDLLEGVITYNDILKNTAAIDWPNYSQTEVEGVVIVTTVLSLTTTKPVCKQVATCQKVFLRGVKQVCKNQLVCPKT